MPLKDIIKELIVLLNLDVSKLKFVSTSKVYEDNQGAIQVDTIPRMTPTSKYILVK